jgi:hypothetical protein
MGAAGVLICKDNLGRFGGEEGCEFRDIVIVDVHVLTGASIIRSQDPEIWLAVALCDETATNYRCDLLVVTDSDVRFCLR